MHLTTRDLAVLTWLTQFQCATYDQLADLTGASVGALRRRLPRLEEEGLVVRVDARRGDRPIARWFPTVCGAIHTKTGTSPARPDQVDTIRATLLADIALPQRKRGHQILAGMEIRKALDKAAFSYAMRTGNPISQLLPFPDLLIQRGDELVAVELRRGAAAEDDWHRRLDMYDQLGVHQLLLYTDSLALNACLGSPGAYAARVFVTVQVLVD